MLNRAGSILMADPLAESFENVPEKYLTEFKINMGVEFSAFGHTFTTAESIIYLLAAAVIFYVIGILITRKKSK